VFASRGRGVSVPPCSSGSLCDYFSLRDFRTPLYRVLERRESVHALQRQICTQPLPAKRGRRVEELIATSGALTLLTNCVMAWNTQRLQRALDRLRDY
jgi:TnpA family transposase